MCSASGAALDLVRRYGSAVEILEPEEAREQMREEVERLVSLY
jgi:predicted DNA-binding transcriptional regulator YafY